MSKNVESKKESTFIAVARDSEWEPIIESQTPPTLYHYTDSTGLLGITSSQSLWATAAQFSNDPNEAEYGYSLAKRQLATIADRFNSDRILRFVLNRLQKHI